VETGADLERLLSSARIRDDLEVGLAVEERVQPSANDLVVVHDEHPDDRLRVRLRSFRRPAG
jgi:hypothetical protein